MQVARGYWRRPELTAEISDALTASCITAVEARAADPSGHVGFLSLGEWLEAAGTSLDELNGLANPDADGREGGGLDGTRLPFNRMTGMVITVLIRYSNGEPTIQKQPKIWANITAQKQFLAWSGLGSEKIHVVYPSGAHGSQTYEYIDRYSQGVVFDFQPTGRVFGSDPSWAHLGGHSIAALALARRLGSAGASPRATGSTRRPYATSASARRTTRHASRPSPSTPRRAVPNSRPASCRCSR